MSVRMWLLFPLVIAAIVLCFRSVPAAGPSERRSTAERPKFSLEDVRVLAKRASVDDPESVRALTDAILAESPLKSVPESLKSRLHSAELAFRRGAHAPVSEEALSSALNDEVADAETTLPGLPDFLKTTESQVRTVRWFVTRLVPDLAKISEALPESSDGIRGMSPAEAAFVTIGLLHQKLINPDYQVSPDEWDERLSARRTAAASIDWTVSTAVPPPTLRLQRRPVHGSWPPVDLRDEDGSTLRRLHAFLDRLGFKQ